MLLPDGILVLKGRAAPMARRPAHRLMQLLLLGPPLLAICGCGTSRHTADVEGTTLRVLVGHAAASSKEEFGVTLSPQAESYVTQEFEKQAPALDRAAQRYELDDAGRVQFYTAVVDGYFGEVRDETMALAPQRLPGTTAPVVVTSGAAQHYSPSDYLGSIPLNVPTGELAVESEPPHADILLNNQDKGTTNKTLILSTGMHTVRITKPGIALDCKFQVQIRGQGDRARVCCPSPCKGY